MSKSHCNSCVRLLHPSSFGGTALSPQIVESAQTRSRNESLVTSLFLIAVSSPCKQDGFEALTVSNLVRLVNKGTDSTRDEAQGVDCTSETKMVEYCIGVRLGTVTRLQVAVL